jgi:hypothetical protein
MRFVAPVPFAGRWGGRHTYSVVHVFPPGVIVSVAWHSQDRNDPDWPDGVAAARSLVPTPHQHASNTD